MSTMNRSGVEDFVTPAFNRTPTLGLASDPTYFGLTSNGKRHGKGIKFYPNGSQYEGNWKNGKKDGHGTFKFESGGCYIGQWKEDKAHG